MKFRRFEQSLLVAFVSMVLSAPSVLAQPPQSSFGAGWLMVTEAYGDAPLFANERAQLLHAVHGWASSQGAQLMPADTYARLPTNRCAASAIEKAPLEAIYPQVGEIGVSVSCQASKCELTIWVTDAQQTRPRSKWRAEVPTDYAHEVSLWVDAVANLAQVSSNAGSLLALLGSASERKRPLAVSDVAAYGVTKPVYAEDFDALEQALQACYAAKANSSAAGESILLATVQGGKISGCEANVDLSLDRTGARAGCFCQVAKSTTLPAQLSTTGRARVRIELFNRQTPSGPTIELLDERSSANFVKSINSSFNHLVGNLQACFARHPVALPDERKLQLAVGGSGHLQSAHLTGGGANPPLTQCLTTAIRSARFPCTEDNQSASFEATVRTTASGDASPNNTN